MKRNNHTNKRLQNVANRKELLELINKVKYEEYIHYVEAWRAHRAEASEAPYKFTPVSDKQLSFYANPNRSGRFTSFKIPKKSGGEREIYAPTKGLKGVQRIINILLQEMYEPLPCVFGFVPQRSVVDNAATHVGQRYVFNIDLKDFFTSISQARIWGRLQAKPYNLNPSVAGIIAGMCSTAFPLEEDNRYAKGFLPQGAPTSPILTNMICERLDKRLQGLSRKHGLRYSRYADDITFSSDHNVYEEGDAFRKALSSIIAAEGFEINDKKTRLQSRRDRQEVTGLTVGRKVNVSRSYVKQLRTLLHMWELYGSESAAEHFIRDSKQNSPSKNYEEWYGALFPKVIRGKLDFMRMVKGVGDPTYQKLKARYDRLEEIEKPALKPQDMREYLESLPVEVLELLNDLIGDQ